PPGQRVRLRRGLLVPPDSDRPGDPLALPSAFLLGLGGAATVGGLLAATLPPCRFAVCRSGQSSASSDNTATPNLLDTGTRLASQRNQRWFSSRCPEAKSWLEKPDACDRPCGGERRSRSRSVQLRCCGSRCADRDQPRG